MVNSVLSSSFITNFTVFAVPSVIAVTLFSISLSKILNLYVTSSLVFMYCRFKEMFVP